MTESVDGSIYYVQISAEGLFVGSGYYHMASDQLQRWRAAVDDEKSGAAIVKVVDGVEKGPIRDRCDGDAQDCAARVPAGSPAVELLRMKGLTAGKSFPVASWMHTSSALRAHRGGVVGLRADEPMARSACRSDHLAAARTRLSRGRLPVMPRGLPSRSWTPSTSQVWKRPKRTTAPPTGVVAS